MRSDDTPRQGYSPKPRVARGDEPRAASNEASVGEPLTAGARAAQPPATTPEGSPAQTPQDGPRWVPYAPPPPENWRERAALFLRKYGFAVLLIAFSCALLGLLLSSSSGPREGASFGATGSGAVEPRASETAASSGTAAISVLTRPSGAVVFVDGERVGETPLRQWSVPAGVHMISVEDEQFAPFDTLVTLKGDAAPVFAFSLSPRDGEPASPEALAAASSGSQEPRSASAREPAAASSSTPPTPRAQATPRAQDERAPQNGAEGATGGLRIVSEPSGATVFLDGQYAGTTPFTVTGAPVGPHRITYRLEGFESHSREITVAAERTRTIRRTFQAGGATLEVRVEASGAVVHVDGEARPRRSDGTYAVALTPGRHHLIVTHPDLGTWEQNVTLKAGQTRSLTVNFGGRAASKQRRGW